MKYLNRGGYSMSKQKKLRRFIKSHSKLGIHIPTENYRKFSSLTSTMEDFYFQQIMPDKPEYSRLRSIICSLTEIVGLHCESIIFFLGDSVFGKKFLNRLKAGNESFYNKYAWMLDKKLIDENDFQVLENLKNLRNSLIHLDENSSRSEYIAIKPYATSAGLMGLFIKIDQIVNKIDSIYGTGKELKCRIIPGFFDEMLIYHGIKNLDE